MSRKNSGFAADLAAGIDLTEGFRRAASIEHRVECAYRAIKPFGRSRFRCDCLAHA